MDAIKLLKDDHQKVKGLFREYESASDRAMKTKERTADTIFMELEVHTAIEEEIYYPSIEMDADEELKDLVAEAYEEHNVVKTLIEEMRGMSNDDEAYDAKMKVMMENVEHHIEEEEGEMFPMVQEQFGKDVLEEMGTQMDARKKELSGAMSR